MKLHTTFENNNGYISIVYFEDKHNLHILNYNGSVYKIKKSSSFNYDEFYVNPIEFVEQYPLKSIVDWRRREQIEFLSKYKRSLENRIEDLSIAITSGSIADIEQYRSMVGEIQGLSFAVEEIKALLNKYEKDDDE